MKIQVSYIDSYKNACLEDNSSKNTIHDLNQEFLDLLAI